MHGCCDWLVRGMLGPWSTWVDSRRCPCSGASACLRVEHVIASGSIYFQSRLRACLAVTAGAALVEEVESVIFRAGSSLFGCACWCCACGGGCIFDSQ